MRSVADRIDMIRLRDMFKFTSEYVALVRHSEVLRQFLLDTVGDSMQKLGEHLIEDLA